MLTRECRRMADEDPQMAHSDLCTAERVLGDLLELLESRTQERPSNWRSVVHRRVSELAFVNEGGDIIADARYTVATDRQEQLIMAVLERIDMP